VEDVKYDLIFPVFKNGFKEEIQNVWYVDLDGQNKRQRYKE